MKTNKVGSPGQSTDQGMSLYIQCLMKEVEEVISNDGRGPGMFDLIIPTVCHPFDVDVAQTLLFETNSSENSDIGEIQSPEKTDIEFFNKVAWGCSSSSCSQSNSNCNGQAHVRDVAIRKVRRQLISFADYHFQSAASVTAMNQLDLGCLALWLSFHPDLFSDSVSAGVSDVTYIEAEEAVEIDHRNNRSSRDNRDNKDNRNPSGGSNNGGNKDAGNARQWQWKLHKDKVVSGLLNVLGSQKHDPKCLSIAVACLSFIIQQHTAADSVLTDANISQLLRLGLSKAVYPTIDPQIPQNEPKNGTKIGLKSGQNNNDSCILAPQWEISFCRIGVRRLLKIPQVLHAESAVNEAFTFVSKWWERLKVTLIPLSSCCDTVIPPSPILL